MSVSDDEIISMIESGEIVVDLSNGNVTRNGKPKAATVVGDDSKNGTRYRYEFWIGSRRRTILRSKLVYMAGTGKPVPEGFEIHHLDEDRYNDAFFNLIAVSTEDHLKIHRQAAEAVPF